MVDFPITACFGKPNASEFEGFQFDAVSEQKWISPNNAKFYHPIEKRNYYVTTTLEDDGWWKRTSMCKEYTAPRNWENSRPHASINADKEIGPYLNIEIATVIDVLGIEIQVPSLSSPGYSVWILISRGHERFVNEIHRHNSDIVNCSSLRAKEENLHAVCSESSKPAVVNHEQSSPDSNNLETKVEPSSVHRETVASTIQVAPTSLKSSSGGNGGSGGSSNPTSTQPKSMSIYTKKEIPNEDRIWTTIHGYQKCKSDSFETPAFPSVSRIWFDTMTKTNEKQMEQCIGMLCFLYRKEDSEVNLKRIYRRGLAPLAQFWKHQDKVWNPYRWKWRIEMESRDQGSLRWSDHITKTDDFLSKFLTSGNDSLITSVEHESNTPEQKLDGSRNARRKTDNNPLDPFNSDTNEADSIADLKKPRKVKYQSRWRLEQDAVYWMHLSTAQDAGLEFWQTSSSAIAYQSVPKESVVKVVSESGKRELFAKQLTPRERPKVTLRPPWIYERSNTVNMPRETESNLQWPNEDIEQSIDLRVDGIPSDESCKDE